MSSLLSVRLAVLLFSASLLGACADDTAEAEGGGGAGGGEGGAVAIDVPAEAGFIDVPPGIVGPSYASRMFYSFIPASEHPERAPLVLFFNGGPGAATSSILLPYGTGPYALDPLADISAPPAENEHSYTRFANLLYIDARSAGFSYDLEAEGAEGCLTGQWLNIADAADFSYALLEFLAAHEPLRDNPVVLAGESYGGTRSVHMLYMLQHYAIEPEASALPAVSEHAPWLRDKLQQHLDAIAPERAGEAWTADEVAAQFGWQLLIQPSIFGQEQDSFQEPLIEADPDFQAYLADPSTWDGYDVRRTLEEGERIIDHAARAMRTPEQLATLLGVELSSVAKLAAAERGPAFRHLDNYDADEIAQEEQGLHASLGAPAAQDAYWLPLVQACGPYLGDGATLNAFGDVLQRSRTFITNARYDAVVYSAALPAYFDMFSGLEVTVDESLPAGAARPGVIRIQGEGDEIAIRFPSYESGHEVTVGAPRELAEDLEAWLLESGAISAD